mmetsp:Transcript_54763/g.128115  ORF Transcript_54763/g.128115 Transcript_54763/m.128115 type:complete len:225 (+) Transcript_54763:1288-1962(+)
MSVAGAREHRGDGPIQPFQVRAHVCRLQAPRLLLMCQTARYAIPNTSTYVAQPRNDEQVPKYQCSKVETVLEANQTMHLDPILQSTVDSCQQTCPEFCHNPYQPRDLHKPQCLKDFDGSGCKGGLERRRHEVDDLHQKRDKVDDEAALDILPHYTPSINHNIAIADVASGEIQYDINEPERGDDAVQKEKETFNTDIPSNEIWYHEDIVHQENGPDRVEHSAKP